MRFAVDVSTGASVVRYLRGLGHDVLAVADVWARADDDDILAMAVRDDRVVVTNDKDFGELIFRSGRAHAGVVLLRLRDESGPNRVRVMASALAQAADLMPGRFVVASESGIRIRPAESAQ